MKKSIITTLRSKSTSMKDFRYASEKIVHMLAHKALTYIHEEAIQVTTPLAVARGWKSKQRVVLIPIWRSGLALLPVFLWYFEESSIGFIGLKRDEKTKIAKEYYRNIPKIHAGDLVMVLDPMLATGGTACDAIRILKNRGVREKQILLVTMISAPEGIKRVYKEYPKVRLITEIIDKRLNKDKFIVPGIGDFGDRYFGTD